MKQRLALEPKQLRRSWDPADLGFLTTVELPILEGLVGQERAVAALEFGLAIRSPGYNIYVAGPAGTGKTSYSSSLVRAFATKAACPSDWVYVHNFERPDEPLALALPTGSAPAFAAAVEEMIAEAGAAATRALNSKEYHAQRESLIHETRSAAALLMEELEAAAADAGFALTQTERGIMPIPTNNGEPMTEEQFDALAPEVKRTIKEKAQLMQAVVADTGRRTAALEKGLQVHLREHDAKTALAAVRPVVEQTRDHYRGQQQVTEWLRRLEQELVGAMIPGGEPGGEGNGRSGRGSRTAGAVYAAEANRPPGPLPGERVRAPERHQRRTRCGGDQPHVR